MAVKEQHEDDSFPSTRWPLISSARDPDPVRRREALEELLRRYLPALRAHLLHAHRLDRHRAKDFLQGFVADQIFQRDLLASADPARGRFRSFLLRSLENYVSNALKGVARRREVALEHEPAAGAISDVFEIEWARQLLQAALRRMRQECQGKGQSALWELFECRVVVPALTGSPPPSYNSLVECFSFRTAEQAANALVTAKRQFERTLATVIAETEYLAGDKEIQAQIEDLCNILGRAGPLAVDYDRGPAIDHGYMVPGPPARQEDVPVLDESASRELARLLSVCGTAEGNWQPGELGDLLRHCLAAPAGEYLVSGGQSAGFAADSPSEWAAVGMTLDELFQSVQPPLGLLIAVQQSARRLMEPGRSDLPVVVHRLIYFAAIAAALARHGQRISRSSPEVLRTAWQGLVAESYIDDRLKALFGTALEKLPGQEP